MKIVVIKSPKLLSGLFRIVFGIKKSPDDAVKFVVYRFEPGDEIDLENSEAIEGVTWRNEFTAEDPGIYVVTALSRVNQESEPSKTIKVR